MCPFEKIAQVYAIFWEESADTLEFILILTFGLLYSSG